ncbi:DUF1360 domain-containing protein [Bacillus sp. DJP31]|uniref:DUF1360 domain-containing protein n=1 Tax=Bacillus sp. DJP31 TaxID=3409789 RepID=UPI003BB52899
MVTLLHFFLLSLASFRLTRLIVFDNITTFLRKPFHEEITETQEDGSSSTYIVIKGKGIQKWFGELLNCYWCTGIWCAAFLYVAWFLWPTGTEPLIMILAIAGCAAIIETIVLKLSDDE